MKSVLFAALLVFGGAIANAQSYVCDLTGQGSSSWLVPETIQIFHDRTSARVLDRSIMSVVGAPVPASVTTDSRSELVLTWRAGPFTDRRNEPFYVQYIAQMRKDTRRIKLQASVNGANNRGTGSGSCRVLAAAAEPGGPAPAMLYVCQITSHIKRESTELNGDWLEFQIGASPDQIEVKNWATEAVYGYSVKAELERSNSKILIFKFKVNSVPASRVTNVTYRVSLLRPSNKLTVFAQGSRGFQQTNSRGRCFPRKVG